MFVPNLILQTAYLAELMFVIEATAPVTYEDVLSRITTECTTHSTPSIGGSWVNRAKLIGSSCFFIQTASPPVCENQGARSANIMANDISEAIFDTDFCRQSTGYFRVGLMSDRTDATPSTVADLRLTDEQGNLMERFTDHNVTVHPVINSVNAADKAVRAMLNAPPALVDLKIVDETSSGWTICEIQAPGQRYRAIKIESEFATATGLTIENGKFDVRECAFECLQQRWCVAFDHRTTDGRCRLSPRKSDVANVVAAVNMIAYERIM